MPKKGSKAALKKKQKKQKAAAKQKKLLEKQQENKKKQTENKPKIESKQNETEQHESALNQIVDPDHNLKEFCRDINIHNFSLAPIGGGSALIQNADIKLTHGHRYGLIGYNGAGKTTLLIALASGLKEIPDYLRVMHVHQELAGSNLTVLETILKADTERDSLLKEQKRLTDFLTSLDVHDDDPKSMTAHDKKQNDKNDELGIEYTFKLQAVNDRLKFIEADTAESRASHVLEGLCFTDRMKNMKTSDLSGGWRMRVSLASALFVEPDLLLLDEPTNHLDFPSVIWLSEYLAFVYPEEKTVLVVSHDRRFLNDICSDIIHLERRKLKYYKGNFDAFGKIRSEMRVHQRKQYERQQKMIDHNKRFIEKFKANKKWSTQAQSRMKLLSRVNKIEAVLNDLEFRFSFPRPEKVKNPLLFHLDDVTFGYYGELKGKDISSYILHKINLRVQFGSKIGILGANGAGKSTLIKLIMQELDPVRGTCHLQNSVNVGFFGQHHLDHLDFKATPIEHLKNTFGSGATIQQVYAQLGRFMLGDKFAKQKIGTLSGGQKSRVAFSILTWYSPHLIIMDEPTNHLDMPTIDALAIALSEFEGTILIVSHDQHFVETCCDEFWCVGQRGIKIFDDFDKCRNFSKKCKAPNVLPREFSTVNVKRKLNLEEKENKMKNGKKNGKNGMKNTKNGKKKGKNDKNGTNGISAFGIDPEREINKGMEKGLTPNGILRHIKGWKPVDGNLMIVTKLGFIMFHDFYNDKNKHFFDMDCSEYFGLWKNIINYCIPLDHEKNQYELINIAMKTFIRDKKDHPNSKRVNTNYSFGLVLEAMVKEYEMFNVDILNKYKEEIEKKSRSALQNKVLGQIDTFIHMANEDDDESDSDSD